MMSLLKWQDITYIAIGRLELQAEVQEKSQGKKYIEENLLEQMDKLLEQV